MNRPFDKHLTNEVNDDFLESKYGAEKVNNNLLFVRRLTSLQTHSVYLVTCFERRVSDAALARKRIRSFVGSRHVETHIRGNAQKELWKQVVSSQ
jgi:hypothetical protein